MGSRVYGVGCKSGKRLKVWGLGFRVPGYEVRSRVVVFGVHSLGVVVLDLRFRVSGFGFWGVVILDFRV